MIKNSKIRVRGEVQGVGFRAATKRMAIALGINGNIRNEADGSVLIEAEGDEGKMEEFISWCHKGPAQATVSEVQITSGVVQGFSEFVVSR